MKERERDFELFFDLYLSVGKKRTSFQHTRVKKNRVSYFLVNKFHLSHLVLPSLDEKKIIFLSAGWVGFSPDTLFSFFVF